MSARSVVLALLCGGSLAAAGCPSPEGPVAGDLEVRVVSPNLDDRAILLRLHGRQTAVAAPSGSGYQVLVAPYRADTVTVLVMAPRGQHLLAGAIVRVSVPDTRQVDAYLARPLDVASTAYLQRALTGYTLAVAKP